MALIKQLNIGDKVYAKMLKRIVAGGVKPGERLLEHNLSKDFGVSRTPLRDAITRLAKDGFVETEPRKGCRVRDVRAQDIIEVYDIRKHLEALAITLAADNVREKKLLELKQAFSADNATVLLEADTEFHNLMIRASGNQRLINILDNLCNFIQLLRARGYYSVERSSRATVDHMAMLDALLNRNVELAANLMKDHIEKTKQELLENFKNLQHEVVSE